MSPTPQPTRSCNTNDSSPPDSPITAMLRCTDCGHLVPELNMNLHRVRGCEARKKPAANNNNNNKNDDNDDPMDVDEELSCYIQPQQPPEVDHTTQLRAAPTPPLSNRQSSWENLSVTDLDDDGNEVQEQRLDPRKTRSKKSRENDVDRKPAARNKSGDDDEVIDLLQDEDDDDDDALDTDEDETVEEQWTCSRCTLFNPMNAIACEACGASNPHQTWRQPDPVLVGQLVNDPIAHYFQQQQQQQPPPPASIMSSGALFGGFLGAAASYAGGRSMASGALQGVVNGATGGALLDLVFADSTSQRQQQQQQPQDPTRQSRGQRRSARARAEDELLRYHNHTHNPQQQQQQHSLGRGRPGAPSATTTQQTTTITRTGDGRSGFHTTTVISTPQGTRIITNDGGGPAGLDPFTAVMLQAMLTQPRGGRFGDGDIDGMTYDQLLHQFGDGSENMGASEGQISSLPESTVGDPSSLPEDSRQCNICLEDFEKGEQRKMLPCLHGFHVMCLDKWLRRNGACPICKFRLHDNHGMGH